MNLSAVELGGERTVIAVMPAIIPLLIRIPASAAYAVIRTVRRALPKRAGVHAVALTPEGKLVLVKLRYAPGWRLPGGGRDPTEDAIAAALRELREEIGLTAHGHARAIGDGGALILVEEVEYAPRRFSLEVERVIEADPAALPARTAAITRRWVESALAAL